MTNWHRLLGLALTDTFIPTPFEVELEKDLSMKKQLLDIIIVRRHPGTISIPLPDGLDNLADHNLLTYKSHQDVLDAWSLDELLGHFVNYRKQTSPSLKNLLPVEQFRLYAISTGFPQKLSNEVKLVQVQPGVYETVCIAHRVSVLVLREMPDKPENAVWELFSGVPEKVKAGAKRYQVHSADISSVMSRLFEQYDTEGIEMSYTFEDFRRDYALEHLHKLTPEERLQGLSPEEVLQRFSLEELAAYVERQKQKASGQQQQKASGQRTRKPKAENAG